MSLGKKIVDVVVQAGKGSQVKLSKELLLYIHVTQRKSSLENKVFTEAGRFFFISMKKRQSNPVGPLVLEHLKEHVEGHYTYLMRDNLSKDGVAKKITDDMDKHFGVFLYYK